MLDKVFLNGKQWENLKILVQRELALWSCGQYEILYIKEFSSAENPENN